MQMNKIDILKSTEDYIKQQHLSRYRDKIIKNIDTESIKIDWNKSSYRLYLMFQYLKTKIKDILTGTPKQLEDIILYIEQHYFISSHKIRKLIIKRRELQIKAGSNKLTQFITDNRLGYHLGRNQFKLIKELNESLLLLISNQKIFYLSGEELEVTTCLQNIFNYEDFYKNQLLSNGKLWGAYEYLKLLNFNICPYCDRQFIYTFNKKNKKVRAELDHFYPKSIYPYLALSIMNLVPSCHQCNSSLKGKTDPFDFKIIHPFILGFDNNVIIEIDSKDLDALKGLNTNFELKFAILTNNSDLAEQLKNSIDLFALTENYTAHKLHTQTLLKKASIYTDKMLRDISNMLSASMETYSIEELRRITFPEYGIEYRQGKHVLSKLDYDIVNKHNK